VRQGFLERFPINGPGMIKVDPFSLGQREVRSITVKIIQ
jgi:hypothetical protein